MEDELGSVELRITVNDAEAKKSLQTLRAEIEAVNKGAKGAGRTAAGSRSGGARENIRALEQAQERHFRISQQINRLEERGANVARLRQSLGNLTTAQSNRQFELQRRQSVELSRQIRLSQARLRTEREAAQTLERQQRAAERLGSPAFIARGASLGGARSPLLGAVDIPGSPAFLAAQRRFDSQALLRSASIGGPRSPLNGSIAIPGSPAFLDAARKAGEVQARAFQQEVARAARQGGARSPLLGAVDIPGSPAFNLNQLREQRRRADELRRAEERNRRQEIRNAISSPIRGGTSFTGSPAFLESERRQEARRLRAERAALERSARQGGPSSPVGGRANIPGSPAARLAARRSNEGAISSGLIGFGFPLLFGQGIGASIGGGAGGLAGGKLGGGFGFGLSVLGTAVGAQFDAIIAKATALGKALDSPIANFGAVQENALLSSKSLEKHVASLIASGREAEAAALIQRDLAQSYGGAEAAAKLAKEQDRLNRSYTQLTVGLASLSLGPLADSAQGAADALLGVKAILDGISGFIPPQLRDNAGKATSNLALRTFGTATGTNAAFDILGFLGNFAPRRRAGAAGGSGAIPATDPVLDRQRLAVLSSQNRVVSAQVQGYKALSLEREIQLSKDQEALDLQRLRANKAGAPEIDQRRTAGNQERQRLQEELNQLRRENQRNRELRNATGPLASQVSNASIDGFQGQALEKKLELLRLQRDTRLRQTPQFGSDIRAEYDPQILDDARKLQKFEDERRATLGEIAANSAIAEEAQQRQIRNAQALATIDGVRNPRTREALSQRQQVLESVAAARDRVRSIGAAIDAARIRGGDDGEREAFRLVGEQRLAVEDIRLKLIEGADALRQAGASLKKDLSNAVLQLTEVRSAPDGLNKFLSNTDVNNRAQQDFERLLPDLRQAQGTFTQLTGAAAPEFSGPVSDVNASILDFIQRVNDESKATDNFNDVPKALIISTEGLTSVNKLLADNVNNLVTKKWAVSVAVNADGTSTAYGDVVNRAL